MRKRQTSGDSETGPKIAHWTLGAAVGLSLAIVLQCLLHVPQAQGQANGRLQLHFMNVGQGDGALLVSPKGETVLFDDGVLYDCDKPISYLQQLGVRKIDYHIASHYHADHIGCAQPVLQEFPLQKEAYDRGGTYRGNVYREYLVAVAGHRQTATEHTTITLDAGEPSPVTVSIVALNGDGVRSTNENDLSVVALVKFGDFAAELGGDLSGFTTERYKDIETKVAPQVGKVNVYKVHHHGSSHSTNEAWLQATQPEVAIISVGGGNSYEHPKADCLERLHTAGIRTYWTTAGNGAPPDPTFDVVAGNVVVEMAPGARAFAVNYGDSHVDSFFVAGGQPPPAPAPATERYVWSVRSEVYHYASCSYVENISPANRREGDEPPEGKQLHQGCPR